MHHEPSTKNTDNDNLELSIIIPAHNEERRIGPVLTSYAIFFVSRSVEIIVVLNGCTDRTIDIVREIAQQCMSTIRWVDIAETVGKGGAIQRGFLLARGKAIGFVDADGATSPQEFDRIYSQLQYKNGIIGSRWMKGSVVKNRTSVLRNLASVGFRTITKALFRLPYHDTQCGLKIFKAKVVKTILPKLHNKDMTFDVELLVLLRAHGFAIEEIPTVWIDQSSPVLVGSPWKLLRTSAGMFVSLIQLYFRFMRNHEHEAKTNL